MKNLLNPLLIALIAASASASASAQSAYCKYSSAGNDMWDAANIALALLPGASDSFGAAMAIADILRGRATDKCNDALTIEEVMGAARWIGQEEAEKAISSQLAARISSLRKPTITLDYDLADQLGKLTDIETSAAALSAGKGAHHLSLVAVLKLQVLTEMVDKSFQYDTTTAVDAWGRWFNAMSRYIQEADVSLKSMDKAIRDYRGHVYGRTVLTHECRWADQKVDFYGHMNDGGGREVPGSKIKLKTRDVQIMGNPYCGIMSSESEQLKNQFTDEMRARAWTKNNYGKIFDSVQSARKEIVKSLNRRNALYKAPVNFIEGAPRPNIQPRVNRVTDGIHGEGDLTGNVLSALFSDQYQTDGTEGLKNVKIEVPGAPFPTSACPSGGSTHPTRWPIVGVGFRAQVSPSKNPNRQKVYTVKAYRKDGSTDDRFTKKITVTTTQRSYYFSLLTQPYNEAIQTAPLISKITIEGTPGDDFELDEVYAIAPNVGIGMTANVTAVNQPSILGTPYGAIDGSAEGTPPEIKPAGLFQFTSITRGGWAGIMAKPTKLGQIQIQIHSDTPSKFYKIELFDKWNKLKHTFRDVLPDGTGVWRSPVCGSTHDLHWVKKVIVTANDNGPFGLDEFRAKA
ncbi:MAG: hypothetical protein ACOVN3_00475, partial [Limnohabitans sp.]